MSAISVCACMCVGEVAKQSPSGILLSLSGMKVAISPTAGSAAGRQSSAVSCLQKYLTQRHLLCPNVMPLPRVAHIEGLVGVWVFKGLAALPQV